MAKKTPIAAAHEPTEAGTRLGCPGKGVAYGFDRFPEPHSPGRFDWGRCWKCNGSLGCSTCTTSNGMEILCIRCGAWGTETAFLHHGAILENDRVPWTPFSAYPAAWRAKYEPHPLEGKIKPSLSELTKAAEPKEVPEVPAFEREEWWQR